MHKHPSQKFYEEHLGLLILFMLCCALLNNIITAAITNPFADNIGIFYLLTALCKYITALLPLFLMARWKLFPAKRGLDLLWGFLLGAPCLLYIAENLLPLILVNTTLFQVQPLPIAAIILANFGVGLMEEAGCRGVILPVLCRRWADQKEGRLKAALFSSGLFALAHLAWLLNALLFRGALSAADCIGRLFQVYYAFCFGMLAAGVTLYAGSILPMVIWHSLIDISAFIDRGILSPINLQYYYDNLAGLDKVLVQWGLIRRTGPAYWIMILGLDTVLLVSGILLAKSKKPFAPPCQS